MCPADALHVRIGTFVISYTYMSKGPGKHRVVFYLKNVNDRNFLLPKKKEQKSMALILRRY